MLINFRISDHFQTTWCKRELTFPPINAENLEAIMLTTKSDVFYLCFSRFFSKCGPYSFWAAQNVLSDYIHANIKAEFILERKRFLSLCHMRISLFACAF